LTPYHRTEKPTITTEPGPEVNGHLQALAKTPRMEKDFPNMIPKRCSVCHATTGLLRCSACSIYYYCGQAHQKADRTTHRKLCDTIKGTKKQVADTRPGCAPKPPIPSRPNAAASRSP
jgi:hypothetical protein